MTAPIWTDWLTRACYRVRVSLAAGAKLAKLSNEAQERLRQMLEEITEHANLFPSAKADEARPELLSLQLGRICIRYSIDSGSRTLTIEHVIFLDDEEPLGQTG